MRTSIFLFLLLALWTLSSQGELKKLGKAERDSSERVLIRTKRRWVLSTIDLEEEYPGPFPKVLTTLFNDKQVDHTVRFYISGQGVTEDPKNVFSINEKTGIVYVHKTIDREAYPNFLVNFDVADGLSGDILDRTLAFNVAIKDKNDNPPVFTHKVLQARIAENIKEGQLPITLMATDKDEKDNNNSRIAMKILSQDPAWPKIILKTLPAENSNSMISQLIFTGCFDYDKVKTHTLLIEAKDHGIPSLSSTATVSIAVTDSNTHAPVFTASKYNAEVMEMTTTEILRVAVTDLDTPNTPASRAVYTILKGNEGGNYEITTDPATNEGVLRVVKGCNYEANSQQELQIGVENEELLFSCVDGKPFFYAPDTVRQKSAVSVFVAVLNENDPPVFEKKIMTVFRIEEGDPGDVLYIPTVMDEDSDLNNVRFSLVEDPAEWMSIDPKTGKITAVKKMDRESPFVHNNTYSVVMTAVDDGKPPATGTSTLMILLGDKNDNKPRLTSNTSIMCVNKAEQVMVKAVDDDNPPYGAPFTFILGNEDLKSQWNLEPPTGSETSLISLKPLPYGDYSVPLTILDQQGLLTEAVLQVTVCDCSAVNECGSLRPRSSSLGGAAIGVLLASLLMLALLFCMCFLCECREKKMFIENYEDEGIQSLRSWNVEVLPKEEKPFILFELENSDYQKPNTVQLGPQFIQNVYQMTSVPMTSGYRDTVDMTQTLRNFNTWSQNRTNSKTWSQNRTNSKTWNKNRTNSMMRNSKTINTPFEQYLSEHIERKVSELPERQFDIPKYQPHEYNCEGTDSECVTLDKLSLHSTGDLKFLENLGPKFQTLEEICKRSMEEKNIKA